MTRVALMTHNNGNGGAALAVSRLAKGLTINTSQSAEFDFALLAAVVQDKDFSVIKKQIGGSNYPPLNFARIFLSKAISKTWSYIHNTNNNPRVFCMQGYRDLRLELQDFDIINLFWMQTLADLSKLSRLQQPKVITLHDMWFLTGGCSYSFSCEQYRTGCRNCDFMWKPVSRDARKQFMAKDKILSNENTHVVVTSKWMYDISLARGIHDSKISMIKNYIPDSYHYFDDKILARDLLGINSDLKDKVILYFIGSISDPRKGFDLFCNAIVRLPSHLKKEILVLHLGPVDNSYDSLLEDNGIDIVHLGIFSEEVSQIIGYNAADYLICPSRYDNTPNVIAEAHMCGLPVIASNTTGASEMVIDKTNGFLADVENADEFMHTLFNAFSKNYFFSRSTISSYAKSLYGFHATCKNYLNLYRSML